MRNYVRSFLGVFAVATLVALVVRLFIVEDYRIASQSMFPNLMDGDLVFVSKFSYNLHLPFSSYELVSVRRPHRPEIVTFTLPERGSETFVKRVVAVDGDRVEIKNGVLTINGIAAKYNPVGADPLTVREEIDPGGGYVVQREKVTKDYGPVTIPLNHFFVLGDNRAESNDSRTWGPVPYSCLKGRVQVVWLSLNEKGALRHDRIGFWPNNTN